MSTTKYPIAIIAGLSLAGSLAGCSSAAATSTASYLDGSYTESGDYQSPSGTESVEVTLTLTDNVVTAVTVIGDATDPQAKLHQSQFSDGIAAVAVGKNLDELTVDKVGGSSLTSDGFNRAVEAIKADAAK